jgi:acetolactate synthase-1/2/3 large subunit
MKCSEFIVKILKKNKIGHVFDYTGGMVVHIEDSIHKQKGIICLPTRHEQAAGFAAEGYSRVNGNFGVAIATSGPGATNLITAIGSCYFDSTKALFITGQVNTADIKVGAAIRQNGFQETDIVTIVNSITKYSKIILNVKMIQYELEKALYIMKNGRPGPVLLDIPYNIQTANINLNSLPHFIGSVEHKKMEATNKLKNKHNIPFAKIEKMLKKSKRPVIIAGNGIKLSKTQRKLRLFAKNNNIPVVCSLLGLGTLPADDKNFIGFIGTYGNRHANIVLANADLVIALGSRLDLRQTGDWKKFIQNKSIMHVDIDNYSKKKGLNNYLFANCDLNVFFDALSGFKMAENKKWNIFVDEVKKQFNSEDFYQNREFLANRFIEKLSDYSPKHTIVTADVGQNQMWLAQSWNIKDGQKMLFSGGMGAMGFSLPVAVGAACADPNANITAICGDGGFQMNIQELETIKFNNLPIKIIVLNNKSLGMVREFQDEYLNGVHQSTVLGYSCPNIKKVAQAFGLRYKMLGEHFSKRDIIDVIKSKKPVVIEVILSPKSRLQPKAVYGFSLESQRPHLSEKNKTMLDLLKEKYLI